MVLADLLASHGETSVLGYSHILTIGGVISLWYNYVVDR